MPEKSPQEEKFPEKSSEEILKSFQSDNPVERREAILDCMEWDIKKCIPELRKRIVNDSDLGVKSVAAVALGEFQDKQSIPAIVNLKKNPDIFPETIIDALSRMEDPRSGPHLVEYLAFSNHTVRLLAIDGLSRCQATNQGSTILKMALSNKDPEKDKTYAMALGKISYRPAENYLLSVVNRSEDGPTKAAGLLALGRVGSKKATPILIEALGSEFAKGRENAYLSLKETKDPSGFSKLVGFLQHKDRDVRFFSAEIIAQLKSPAHLKRIREEFANGNEKSLAPSAQILGEWKDEESRKSIESVLLNQQSPDREDLAKSLGWLGNSESEPVLWEVLAEKSGEARYGAAWALGFAGTEKSVDRLVLASQSSDRRLASAALESLGQLKSPSSIDALVKSSSDDNLAPFSIPALNQIEGERARMELEKLATSNKIIQSKLAIESLGRRGDPASLPVLEKITMSSNPELRKLARFAIKNFKVKKD
ncbi:MAG: HEAT repeat domain-containing protein [Leptospira sp.]|nr:HEAT repeat domain-containing protein [Leptospira sp.]